PTDDISHALVDIGLRLFGGALRYRVAGGPRAARRCNQPANDHHNAAGRARHTAVVAGPPSAASGTQTSTWVPPPGFDRICSVAPTCSARSLMLIRPSPWCAASTSNPTPSSVTVSTRASGSPTS